MTVSETALLKRKRYFLQYGEEIFQTNDDYKKAREKMKNEMKELGMNEIKFRVTEEKGKLSVGASVLARDLKEILLFLSEKKEYIESKEVMLDVVEKYDLLKNALVSPLDYTIDSKQGKILLEKTFGYMQCMGLRPEQIEERKEAINRFYTYCGAEEEKNKFKLSLLFPENERERGFLIDREIEKANRILTKQFEPIFEIIIQRIEQNIILVKELTVDIDPLEQRRIFKRNKKLK